MPKYDDAYLNSLAGIDPSTEGGASPMPGRNDFESFQPQYEEPQEQFTGYLGGSPVPISSRLTAKTEGWVQPGEESGWGEVFASSLKQLPAHLWKATGGLFEDLGSNIIPDAVGGKALRETGRSMIDSSDRTLQETMPKFVEDSPEFYAHNIASSLLNMAATVYGPGKFFKFMGIGQKLLAGEGLVSQVAKLVPMAGQQAMEQYATLKTAGFGEGASNAGALVYGLAEAGGEVLPLAYMGKAAKAMQAKNVGGFGKAVGQWLISEPLGEAATSAVESGVDKLTTNPEMTAADFIQNQKQTFITVLGQSLFMLGAGTGAGLARNKFFPVQPPRPEIDEETRQIARDTLIGATAAANDAYDRIKKEYGPEKADQYLQLVTGGVSFDDLWKIHPKPDLPTIRKQHAEELQGLLFGVDAPIESLTPEQVEARIDQLLADSPTEGGAFAPMRVQPMGQPAPTVEGRPRTAASVPEAATPAEPIYPGAVTPPNVGAIPGTTATAGGIDVEITEAYANQTYNTLDPQSKSIIDSASQWFVQQSQSPAPVAMPPALQSVLVKPDGTPIITPDNQPAFQNVLSASMARAKGLTAGVISPAGARVPTPQDLQIVGDTIRNINAPPLFKAMIATKLGINPAAIGVHQAPVGPSAMTAPQIVPATTMPGQPLSARPALPITPAPGQAPTQLDRAYGNRGTISALSQAKSPEARKLASELRDMAAIFANFQSRVGAPGGYGIPAGYNIGPEIGQAADMYASLVNMGGNVSQYLSGQIAGPQGDTVKALVEIFDVLIKNNGSVSEFLWLYTQAVEAKPNMNLPPHNVHDIIEAAYMAALEKGGIIHGDTSQAAENAAGSQPVEAAIPAVQPTEVSGSQPAEPAGAAPVIPSRAEAEVQRRDAARRAAYQPSTPSPEGGRTQTVPRPVDATEEARAKEAMAAYPYAGTANVVQQAKTRGLDQRLAAAQNAPDARPPMPREIGSKVMVFGKERTITDKQGQFYVLDNGVVKVLESEIAKQTPAPVAPAPVAKAKPTPAPSPTTESMKGRTEEELLGIMGESLQTIPVSERGEKLDQFRKERMDAAIAYVNTFKVGDVIVSSDGTRQTIIEVSPGWTIMVEEEGVDQPIMRKVKDVAGEFINQEREDVSAATLERKGTAAPDTVTPAPSPPAQTPAPQPAPAATTAPANTAIASMSAEETLAAMDEIEAIPYEERSPEQIARHDELSDRLNQLESEAIEEAPEGPGIISQPEATVKKKALTKTTAWKDAVKRYVKRDLNAKEATEVRKALNKLRGWKQADQIKVRKGVLNAMTDLGMIDKGKDARGVEWFAVAGTMPTKGLVVESAGRKFLTMFFGKDFFEPRKLSYYHPSEQRALKLAQEIGVIPKEQDRFHPEDVDKAIDALREYRDAHNGRLPGQAALPVIPPEQRTRGTRKGLKGLRKFGTMMTGEKIAGFPEPNRELIAKLKKEFRPTREPIKGLAYWLLPDGNFIGGQWKNPLSGNLFTHAEAVKWAREQGYITTPQTGMLEDLYNDQVEFEKLTGGIRFRTDTYNDPPLMYLELLADHRPKISQLKALERPSMGMRIMVDWKESGNQPSSSNSNIRSFSELQSALLKRRPEDMVGKARSFYTVMGIGSGKALTALETPIFESKIDEVIDSKGFPSKAQAIPNALIKAGIKPAEIKYHQIEQWLKDNVDKKTGKIDKDALKQFIILEAIEMTETMRGKTYPSDAVKAAHIGGPPPAQGVNAVPLEDRDIDTFREHWPEPEYDEDASFEGDYPGESPVEELSQRYDKDEMIENFEEITEPAAKYYFDNLSDQYEIGWSDLIDKMVIAINPDSYREGKFLYLEGGFIYTRYMRGFDPDGRDTREGIIRRLSNEKLNQGNEDFGSLTEEEKISFTLQMMIREAENGWLYDQGNNWRQANADYQYEQEQFDERQSDLRVEWERWDEAYQAWATGETIVNPEEGALEISADGQLREATYYSYVTPGDKKNYREILVRWNPTPKQKEYLRSVGLPDGWGGHYSGGNETNTLFHIRISDRIDADGKKILYIEEIQSDWLQRLNKQEGGPRRPKTLEDRRAMEKLNEEYQNERTKISGLRRAYRDSATFLSGTFYNTYDKFRDAVAEITFTDEVDALQKAEMAARRGQFETSLRLRRGTSDSWEEAAYRADAALIYLERLKAFPEVEEKLPPNYREIVTQQAYHVKLDVEKVPENQFLLNTMNMKKAEQLREYDSNAPMAPFAGNWQEVAIKRMIRWAVEHGYDGISIPQGNEQIRRYNLEQPAKHVASQLYAPGVYKLYAAQSLPESDEDGSRLPPSMRSNASDWYGEIVVPGTRDSIFPESKLVSVLGRELADRVIAAHKSQKLPLEFKYFDDVNIKYGGKGMRVEYGEPPKQGRIPALVQQIAKTWGAETKLDDPALRKPKDPKVKEYSGMDFESADQAMAAFERNSADFYAPDGSGYFAGFGKSSLKTALEGIVLNAVGGPNSDFSLSAYANRVLETAWANNDEDSRTSPDYIFSKRIRAAMIILNGADAYPSFMKRADIVAVGQSNQYDEAMEGRISEHNQVSVDQLFARHAPDGTFVNDAPHTTMMFNDKMKESVPVTPFSPFQTTTEQAPLPAPENTRRISPEEIRQVFKGKGMKIAEVEDGWYELTFPNKATLRVKNVAAITADGAEFQLSYTGPQAAGETIAGVYDNGKIMVVKDLAGRWGLTHESYHFLEDSGFISPTDAKLLSQHVMNLRKQGKYDPGRDNVAPGSEEDRAYYVQQILSEQQPMPPKGMIQKMLDRIRQFIDGLANMIGISTPGMAERTAGRIVSGMETGSIYEQPFPSNAKALGYAAKTLNPMSDQAMKNSLADYFRSALRDAVANEKFPTDPKRIPNVFKAQQIKPAELAWFNIDQWIKDNTVNGKIDKQALLAHIDRHQPELSIIVLGTPIGKPPQWTMTNDAAAAKETLLANGFGFDYNPAEEAYFNSFGKERYGKTAFFDDGTGRRYVQTLNFDGVALRDFIQAQTGIADPDELTDKVAEVLGARRTYAGELENWRMEVRVGGDNDNTKWKMYSIPGGKDYREILVTWTNRAKIQLTEGGTPLEPFPYKAYNQPGQTEHYPQQNIVLHMRIKEHRDAQGRRMLQIEEIQSDLHQQGLLYGYYTPEWETEQRKAMESATSYEEKRTLTEKFANVVDAPNQTYVDAKFPDAPFKDTSSWAGLGVKWAMRFAAEQGYDGITWASPESQLARFGGLRKTVYSVWHTPAEKHPYTGGTRAIPNKKMPVIHFSSSSQADGSNPSSIACPLYFNEDGTIDQNLTYRGYFAGYVDKKTFANFAEKYNEWKAKKAEGADAFKKWADDQKQARNAKHEMDWADWKKSQWKVEVLSPDTDTTFTDIQECLASIGLGPERANELRWVVRDHRGALAKNNDFGSLQNWATQQQAQDAIEMMFGRAKAAAKIELNAHSPGMDMISFQNDPPVVHGEGGMEYFYRKWFDGWTQKYVSQWGAKVEPAAIIGKENAEGAQVFNQSSVYFNEKMKDSLLQKSQKYWYVAKNNAMAKEVMSNQPFPALADTSDANTMQQGDPQRNNLFSFPIFDKVGQTVKNWKDISKNVKDTDLTALQALVTQPWNLRNKYPKVGEALTIEIQRNEARKEKQSELLADPDLGSFPDFVEHPIFEISDNEEKMLRSLMFESTTMNKGNGKFMNAGEVSDFLKKENPGIPNDQIKRIDNVYRKTKKSYDTALAQYTQQLQHMALFPYRDKPWYSDLVSMLNMKAKERKAFYAAHQSKDMKAAYATIAQTWNLIRKNRQATGRVAYYAPLDHGEGEYVTRVYIKDGEAGPDGIVKERVVWSHRTKTKLDAAKIVTMLRSDPEYKGMAGARISTSIEKRTPENIYQRVYDDNLYRFIQIGMDRIKEGGKMSDTEIARYNKELARALAEELKARGFSKRLIERRAGSDIKGYELQDQRVAFANYMSGLAGLITKQQASAKFYDLLKTMPKDEPRAYDYVAQYIRDMLRNQDAIDESFQKLKSGAALYYIAGNLRLPLVQVSQNFVMSVPKMAYHIAKMEGAGTRDQLLGNTRGLMSHMGKAHQRIFSAAWDVARGNLSEPEKMALGLVTNQGVTDPKFIQEIYGKMSTRGDRGYRKAFDWLMYPFMWMEKLNRQTAFLAMFRQVKADQKAAGIDTMKSENYMAAFAKAVDFVYDTQVLYGKANSPEAMRGAGVGNKLLGLSYTFKQYPHHYLSFLKQGIQEGHAATIEKMAADIEAFKIGPSAIIQIPKLMHTYMKNSLTAPGYEAVMLSMAWTMAWGGLLALPFLDDILELYEKKNGYPLRANMNKLVRTGAPAILGMDFTNSMKVSAPWSLGTNFMESLSESALGVYGGLIEKFGKSMEQAWGGNMYKAIESGMPTTMEYPMKALREYSGGMTNPRGRTIFDSKGQPMQPSIYEAGLQAVGIKPERVSTAQRELRTYTNIEQQMTALRDKVYRLFRDGKTEEGNKALTEYNLKAQQAPGAYPRIGASQVRGALQQKPDKGYMAFGRSLSDGNEPGALGGAEL